MYLSGGVVIGQALVVLVGLIVFDLVYGSTISSRARRRMKSAPRLRVLDVRRTVFLGIAAVILTPVFVQSLGGFDVLFTSREARTEVLFTSGLYSSDSKASGAILTSFASVVPFVALYAMTALLATKSYLRRKIDFIALYAAVVIVNIALNNPISSSRFWFLVVVLSLCFVFPWSRSVLGVRSIIAAFVGGSVVLFPYLDAFRYSERTQDSRGIAEMILEKSDYDSMVQVGNAITYVTQTGYSMGENLLGALLFWVPRSIWPDKPIDTGTELAQYVSYHNPNLSAPLWAEGYWAFGIVGVVLVFWLLGYVCGRLSYVDSVQRRLFGSFNGWAFILAPLAVYEVLILRGSLLQAMSRLTVLVFLLVACTAVVSMPEALRVNSTASGSGSGGRSRIGVQGGR